MKPDTWHKCEVCGRFIAWKDFASGEAIHRLVTPSSDLSEETWETLCRHHWEAEEVIA